MNLKARPFDLTDADIEWVKTTLASMSDEEKVAQLFCLIAYSSEDDYLVNCAEKIRLGGLMCRPMPAQEIVKSVRILQEKSRIPMLLAANLERGGNGAAQEGTSMGSPMAIGATGDAAMAAKLGEICGREGVALGLNWSFAPIIDIDFNFRNPITNTRTFGSDPRLVRTLGLEYVKAVQKHGLAASIKHFPGDGTDERDQHLVVAINDLSCEEWDQTYGAAYKACIDAGSKTVMVGHIMHPAYSKALNPSLEDEEILPASLSHELCTGLLREKLGFNGLIVTDASTMAGMMIPMPRSKMVPQAIAAGCDMFLFTRNQEEDFAFMRKGIEDGIITPQRLTEALTRILALKASLGLHKKKGKSAESSDLRSALSVLGNEEHVKWAQECANRSITLVKEEPNVLPLTPQRYKRVLFYPIESAEGYHYSVRTGVMDLFKRQLVSEGFSVDQFEPKQGMEGLMTPIGDIVGKYDLLIYLANMATKSNQTTVRIEWAQPMGANVPVFMTSVPSIFISLENPYHLLDVPRMRTYINTYGSTDIILGQLMDKLMGRSLFQGVSPVDAFCGKWDTRLS